jgi:hypothetical protein
MYLKKAYILFIVPTSFAWLSVSQVNAAPRLKRTGPQGLSWENSRLNVELSWGAIPCGKFLKWLNRTMEFDTHFNYSAKILAGYSFPVFEDKKIGFETGLGYGFARVIGNEKYNATLEESHLAIPLLLTCLRPFQTSFYFAHTTIIGYEFNIILNSMYKQSGYYVDFELSLRGDKDVAESLPDFSRLSGSIVCSERYDFPKGIYAAFTTRFSIEMFKLIEEAGKGLNMELVRLARWLNTNWIELTRGVNIVDWIYPQEKHQGKNPNKRKI